MSRRIAKPVSASRRSARMNANDKTNTGTTSKAASEVAALINGWLSRTTPITNAPRTVAEAKRAQRKKTRARCPSRGNKAASPLSCLVWICGGSIAVSLACVGKLPACVMMQRAVVRPVGVQHHRAPVEREQQHAPARARGPGEEAEGEGEPAAEHDDRAEQPVAFVDVAESGDGTEAHGHAAAKSGEGIFRLLVHPVAFGAFGEVVGQKRRAAERAGARFGERRIGVGGGHV